MLLTVTLLISFFASPLWGQEAKKTIEVFPSAPFYQYIIYETLAIFWIALIGVIVIIRMKLREAERVQKMMGPPEEPPASQSQGASAAPETKREGC